MTQNTAADVLRSARTLVERGWCQGSFERAGSHCAAGAVIAAVCEANADEDARYAAFNALLSSMRLRHSSALWAWNDAEGRTKAEVVAAFDKAIEHAAQVSA